MVEERGAGQNAGRSLKIQRDKISDINDKTSKVIANLKDSQRPTRGGAILRLVFIPPAIFLYEFLVRGAFVRGLEGYKHAVNRWAFVFTLEAKRYERFFGDDTQLIQKNRDFS